MTSENWTARLIDDDAGISRILAATRRVAVLGIKVPSPGVAAFFVPEFVQRCGFEVIPVPVYFPEVTEILGEKVYRTLREIPGTIDVVNVFRRPKDIPAHVDDILAARPACVWMQEGIEHAGAAETFARAGIDVVQNRCLMVELDNRGYTPRPTSLQR